MRRRSAGRTDISVIIILLPCDEVCFSEQLLLVMLKLSDHGFCSPIRRSELLC